jgi:hypothetical protein
MTPLPAYFVKIQFNSIPPPIYFQDFQLKPCIQFSSPCPAHPILPDLITIIISGVEAYIVKLLIKNVPKVSKFVIFHKYYGSDQIKPDDIDGA